MNEIHNENLTTGEMQLNPIDKPPEAVTPVATRGVLEILLAKEQSLNSQTL
jgi:hypothetical protein